MNLCTCDDKKREYGVGTGVKYYYDVRNTTVRRVHRNCRKGVSVVENPHELVRIRHREV
jgi:hypothetical protein